ncbi:beta strand repeat-containing protein [Burkholderia gladioli]|uniref:beta strand repeat-containing protein n=3 Tax=Burkholderia gladioli TaxID=28095 RepID=UPI00202F9FC9|nr:matrixin family metalloprotease [Burkholderia gladioli]URV24123.1 matrixin family metalloprotease [Burkholderia gladioli]
MSLIDEVGYSAASVDGIASVQEAEEALNKNPTDPKAQYNYLAAYDNAIAAEAAIIPVAGAVFASMAIKADVQNIFYSGINASTMIPLLSNIAILATQGVALLDGGEVVVAAGGVAFTLDELTAYAGNYLTALGVNVDAGTIQNYMEQSVAQLGLSPNSDGSYPINVGSNSTFNFEPDGTVDLSFSSDASPAGTTSQIFVPTLDSSGNIIGFVATTPAETYPNGGGYAFGGDNAPSVNTDSQTLHGLPSSPSGASPTGLWNIPGSDGSYRNLVQYSDGTYGTLTTTASGAPVVNMQNISAPPPGQSNQVNTTDNNGQLSSEISGSGAIDNINGASVTIDGGATATVVGSNDTVSSPLAGSAFTLEGTDNQVNASGSTIILAQNSLSDEVVGNQDAVTDVTGSGSVEVSGASNTINTSSGTSVTLSNTNGGFDTVNSNGDQANGSAVGGISLGSNTQANVNGGNNEINEATGDSLGVYGGGNIINTTSGADLVVGNTSGDFDTVNASSVAAGGTTANGQNTGIWIDGNAQANINGDNDSLGINAGDSVGVYGGGNVISATSGADLVVGDTNGDFDTVNASGVAAGGSTANGQNTGIWINGDAQANINGSNNNLGVNAGDSVGVYGGGNVISATSGADLVVGNTSGSFDTVNASGVEAGGTTANGQNTGIWINGDAQANINGNDNNLGVNAGDSVGVYGGGNVVNTTAGALVVADGTNGSYDTINGNGDSLGGTAANGQGTGIWIAADSQANVSGNDNGISLSALDSTGVYGGGNVIYTTAGVGVAIGDTNGSYDTINGSGDATGGTTANGQSTGIWFASNSQANVNGDNDNIGLNSGDSVGVYGGGNVVDVSADTDVYIADTDGSFDTINGNDDALGSNAANGQDSGIFVASNSQVDVYGDFDGVDASGASLNVDGVNDSLVGSGDTIDFGGDASDDIVEGTDDTGTGWSGVDYINEGSYGYGYGYGYFGGYGFSGDRSTVTSKLASDVTAIAQFDQSQGNAAAATAAQQGFAQAAEMSQDAQSSSGSGPNVLEGARWNAPTITWSFSGASDPQEAQYESSIEQAFATWAAASGLQFQEVSGGTSADISVNWADLNTASTGEVGYTTFKAAHGVIAPGASISLESPTEDALTSSSGSDPIYAGTEATFYQTVLHEIGHALGLADNADSGSIMNYDLTSSNRTLDQTDINAIEALYGSSAQTAALIQAMAGGAAGSTSATVMPVEQASMQTQLLAGAH